MWCLLHGIPRVFLVFLYCAKKLFFFYFVFWNALPFFKVMPRYGKFKMPLPHSLCRLSPCFPLLPHRGGCCHWKKCPQCVGKWGNNERAVNNSKEQWGFPLFPIFCPLPQHIFRFENFVNLVTDCSTPLINEDGSLTSLEILSENGIKATGPAECHAHLKLVGSWLCGSGDSFHKIS